MAHNPDFGLPAAATLRRYRIWDSYFTPAHSHPGRDSERILADIERSLPAIRLGHFEKLCYFAHVGTGTTSDDPLEEQLRLHPESVVRPLQRWPQLLIPWMQLNVRNKNACMNALDRWLRDGPMAGVYFPGGGPGATACTHPNFPSVVRRIGELRGMIMQHTWLKTGGKQNAGESTPGELAKLAAKFPEQIFICAHAGGEWEQGIRSVRRQPNVYVETSGFDATSGFIEMAVQELGAERILFGSHLPSRSLGTELSKILCAKVSERDKHAILGGNLRRLLKRSSTTRE